jgi:hypothetical protein
LDPIFPFDEVNVQLLEFLESKIIPTDGDDALGIDDVGVDLLTPGIIVDVRSWHHKIRVDTLNTEL